MVAADGKVVDVVVLPPSDAGGFVTIDTESSVGIAALLVTDVSVNHAAITSATAVTTATARD